MKLEIKGINGIQNYANMEISVFHISMSVNFLKTICNFITFTL